MASHSTSYSRVHILGAAVMLLLCSCNQLQVKKSFPEINDVPADSKFQIILPEDHRTGYLWQLSEGYDPSVVERINEVWHGNEKGIYFNLKAAAAGQTTLTFVSRKYRDTANIKLFIVKIIPN
jgi:hypothetical protein